MKQPRFHLNLASEPFHRDRPIFIASAIICGLLTVALLVQISLIVAQRGQASEARTAIAALDRESRAIEREQTKFAGLLSRPENAAVLEQSVFINELLARKGISWTKIFSDLETVVPYNVRLISVKPQVNQQNQILLDLFVGAQSPEPPIEMMNKLETSPLFGKTTIVNSLPPSQSEPYFRSRFTVNYAQKL